jgi:transcriptional regulator PpsR
MYSTKIKTDFGTQLPVEISATWLDDQFEPVMALVFRNATNASTVRVDQSAAPDSNMSNIVELVGSSTLKDIVSETTDVIEKICIETAIELTRNNRVAAAEMLGLSRQSLYVKLRKYGMLSKDDD